MMRALSTTLVLRAAAAYTLSAGGHHASVSMLRGGAAASTRMYETGASNPLLQTGGLVRLLKWRSNLFAHTCPCESIHR